MVDSGAVLESLADDATATLFGADRFAIGGHNPLREPKKSGKCRDECHAEANEIDHGILGDGEALGLLINGGNSIEPAVVVTRLAVENTENLACRGPSRPSCLAIFSISQPSSLTSSVRFHAENSSFFRQFSPDLHHPGGNQMRNELKGSLPYVFERCTCTVW